MKQRVFRYVVVAACLLLGCGLAVHFAVKRSFQKHWEENSVFLLTNLYRCWTNDGAPAEYRVDQYHSSRSPVLRAVVDTNTYAVENRPMAALFGAEYRVDGRPMRFVITRDGVILRQKRDGNFRRFSE